MIKLVMFDLDGVTLDTESINVTSKIEEGKKYGFNLTPDIVIGGFGMGVDAATLYFKEKVGPSFPYLEIRHKRFDYIIEHMKKYGLPYKKGILELLDYLDENNIKKIIVTSSPRSYIEAYKKIDKSFFERFDNIVTLDDIKHGKPDPSCYLKGLELGNVNKDEAIILEDSKAGVLAGVNSGIKVIFVEDLLKPDDEIKNIAFKVYKNLFEVKDLLNGKN